MDAKAFLDALAVPAQPHIYVLGSLARHVTVYSQQIRALNLIYSLHETVGLNDRPMMVVGGGVAGLTAAAGALLKGARVTLIESEQVLLPLQGSSRRRYIHPHIYDWPNEEAAGPSADLPVLSWTAGIADEVADMIGQKWATLTSVRHSGKII